MGVAVGRGDCKEVQEVRRGLKVWGGGHKGPGEARGYPRWFWGLGVIMGVSCRGSWGVKRVSKVKEGDEKILGVCGKHRRV